MSNIFANSRCLELEVNAIDTIVSKITDLGFEPTTNPHIFTRKHQKVVIRLVDEFTTVNSIPGAFLPTLFDRHTTVITDNYIMCPTVYKVLKIPDSFFGIYSHTPGNLTWTPVKSFAYSVNRMCQVRATLLLEISKQYGNHLGYGLINFNCAPLSRELLTKEEIKKSFEDFFEYNLVDPIQSQYRTSYDIVRTLVPIKNYDCTHEEMHLRSYINIVAETYYNHDVICFSEKIFRVLSLPVPWVAYASRYAVSYLESLGFDVISNLFHYRSYDHMSHSQEKIEKLIWYAREISNTVKSTEFGPVKNRCEDAANHNRELLINMRQRWPGEFAEFIDRLDQSLAS